jgi:ribosomal protein S18 acetylase RimI-like enzyme
MQSTIVAETQLDYSISFAASTDTEGIVSLIKQLADENNETSPITPDFIQVFLSTPGSNILVAKTEQQILGLLSYSIHPSLFHAASSCTIEDLIVDKKFRNLGIGKKLLFRIMEMATNLKCAEISVSTEKDNQNAIYLYKNNGMIDEFLYLEKHFK